LEFRIISQGGVPSHRRIINKIAGEALCLPVNIIPVGCDAFIAP